MSIRYLQGEADAIRPQFGQPFEKRREIPIFVDPDLIAMDIAIELNS